MAVLDESELTKKPEKITIGFTGDVMLARGVENQHSDNSPRALWGDLVPRLRSLDAFCINLECCLSSRGTKVPDRPYYFRADPNWATQTLQAADVTFVNLANNHVLDYGETALIDTLRALNNANILYAGAGHNQEAARQPATFSSAGLDVAVIGITNNSPSYVATKNTPGTWYVDIGAKGAFEPVRETLETIKKSEPDVIVSSVHLGPNWVTAPSEELQNFAHRLVNAGVDVVHGHSAHVFQGIEMYNGGLILYDCGDFVDDYVVKDGLHNDRSFLFEITFSSDGPLTVQLHPIEITNQTVRSAREHAVEWCHKTMRRRSRPFGTTFERDGDKLVLQIQDS